MGTDKVFGEKYDQRFDDELIKICKQKGLSPQAVNSFDSRFDYFDIYNFLRKDILPSIANAYPSNYTSAEVKLSIENRISPEEAKNLERTAIERIIQKVFPTSTHNYDSRFSQKQRIWCIEEKISPEKANAYHSRFSAEDIIEDSYGLCGGLCWIPPEIVNQYDHNYNPMDIMILFSHGTTPELANRNLGQTIGKLLLLSTKKSEDELKKYSSRFTEMGIRALVDADCLPELANEYSPKIWSGITVAVLYRFGVTPKNTSPEEQSTLASRLDRFFDHSREIDFIRGKGYTLLSVGTQAVIMGNAQSVYKVALDLAEESALFEKLMWEFAPGTTKNVVNKIKGGKLSSVYIIELEHLRGKNLSELLDNKKITFNPAHTIKYSSDIFNGLLELKVAGIFHRDLWLGNIMIDEIEDRAVIVDLGIATDDPEESPKDCRRYGGENDLVSLGQIMYKMIIGKHLFHPDNIQQSTSLIPEETKVERERIMADPATLEARLKEAQENVQDPTVYEIISACLHAKATEEDYRKIKELFSQRIQKEWSI